MKLCYVCMLLVIGGSLHTASAGRPHPLPKAAPPVDPNIITPEAALAMNLENAVKLYLHDRGVLTPGDVSTNAGPQDVVRMKHGVAVHRAAPASKVIILTQRTLEIDVHVITFKFNCSRMDRSVICHDEERGQGEEQGRVEPKHRAGAGRSGSRPSFLEFPWPPSFKGRDDPGPDHPALEGRGPKELQEVQVGLPGAVLPGQVQEREIVEILNAGQGKRLETCRHPLSRRRDLSVCNGICARLVVLHAYTGDEVRA
eukprot:1186383-Prorocentrum_minimum.AAC.2